MKNRHCTMVKAVFSCPLGTVDRRVTTETSQNCLNINNIINASNTLWFCLYYCRRTQYRQLWLADQQTQNGKIKLRKQRKSAMHTEVMCTTFKFPGNIVAKILTVPTVKTDPGTTYRLIQEQRTADRPLLDE